MSRIRWRRCAAISLVGVLGYLAALVILSVALEGTVKRRVELRMAKSLDAYVSVGSVELSLIRGEVVLRDVRIRRHHGGEMRLNMRTVRLSVAPLGVAAVRRSLSRVHIRGVRLELSDMDALAMRREDTRPLSLPSIELHDVYLGLPPLRQLPHVGPFEATISRARTRPMVLQSGLTWLFFLEELSARVSTPKLSQRGVQLNYDGSHLTLKGSVFSDTGIRIEFHMPPPEDGALEGRQLSRVAKALTRALLKQGLNEIVKQQLQSG